AFPAISPSFTSNGLGLEDSSDDSSTLEPRSEEFESLSVLDEQEIRMPANMAITHNLLKVVI
ncbi:MAG TPA: hypothetical protein DCY95_14905, partial [Algoriphagus sp.]|nr:hypothetical protein [Algoriphagus sp.]